MWISFTSSLRKQQASPFNPSLKASINYIGIIRWMTYNLNKTLMLSNNNDNVHENIRNIRDDYGNDFVIMIIIFINHICYIY